MTFRTQIHKKKFDKNGFHTLQGTMSHRPLTNASSLKITAAYCTLYRQLEGKRGSACMPHQDLIYKVVSSCHLAIVYCDDRCFLAVIKQQPSRRFNHTLKFHLYVFSLSFFKFSTFSILKK